MRFFALSLGFACYLMSPARGAEPFPDDGLHRPLLGEAVFRNLLDEDRWEEGFRDLIAGNEQGKPRRQKTDWESIPDRVFWNYHRDIRLTPIPSPGLPDGKSLLLVTFDTDHRVLFDHENRDREFDPAAYPIPEIETRRKPGGETGRPYPGTLIWNPGEPSLHHHVLIFIDSDGRIRWPFGGDNMISQGFFADLNRDGILERVETTNWGFLDKMDFRTVEIETTTIPSRVLLRVIHNSHPSKDDDANRWIFGLADRDEDGIFELEIGPDAGEASGRPLLHPEVSFHWDSEQGIYTGKRGGAGRHWMVPPEEDWDETWWKFVKGLEKKGGLNYPLRDTPLHATVEPEPEFAGENDEPQSWEIPWQERPSYRHMSLKGKSDEELYHFLFEGKPFPAPESPAAFRECRVPGGIENLPPREAALSLVEANRTARHRQHFSLTTAEDVTPPDSGSVVLASLPGWIGSPYWEGFRFGTDAGTTGFQVVGSTKLPPFPDWREPLQWTAFDLPPARARWLGQTIWWLNQVRTVLVDPDAPVEENGFGWVDDVTQYRFSLHSPDQSFLWDLAPALSLRDGWKGRYDARVAHRLAIPLWQSVIDEIVPRPRSASASGSEPEAPIDTGDAVRLLSTPDPVEDWPMLTPVISALSTIADSGRSDLLPLIEKLENIVARPTPADRVTEGQELLFDRAKVDYSKQKISPEFFRTIEANYQRYKRDCPFPGRSTLTSHLEQARLQLQRSGDPAALREWAARSDDSGSAWAALQLKRKARAAVPDRARLETLWKKAVSGTDFTAARALDRLVQEDREFAIAKIRTLEDPLKRAGMLVDLRHHGDSSFRYTAWMIDDLIAALKKWDRARFTNALSALVPEHDPRRYPDPRIDRVIEERVPGFVESPIYGPEYPLLALVKRDRGDEYWDLTKEVYHQRIGMVETEPAAAPPVGLRRALVEMALRNPERLGELRAILEQEFQGNAFIIKGLFDDILVAGLTEELLPSLRRLATASPEEPEGEHADSGSSQSGPIRGGFHRARVCVAAIDEPDPLTRLKLKTGLLFLLRDHPVYFLTSDRKRYLDNILPEAKALSAADREELANWVHLVSGRRTGSTPAAGKEPSVKQLLETLK